MLAPLLVLALLLPVAANAQAEEYFNRGVAHSDKHNRDSAIENFSSALKIKPDYVEALLLRGLAYYNKGNKNRAIEDLNSVLKIKPDQPVALLLRGLAHSDKYNYDLAIEDFSSALKINPDDTLALNKRSEAYFYIGDFDSAIADMETILRIDPNNALAKKSIERLNTARSNSLNDSRDEQKYRTVKIGNQTWMAEDLKFNGNTLHNWNTAKKACPEGWHLPSRDEWNVLINFAGGEKVAGRHLKAAKGWNMGDRDCNGSDTYGFAAYPGGSKLPDGRSPVGAFGSYWWSDSTSTKNGSDLAYYWYVSRYNDKALWSGSAKGYLRSVRCLKD